MATYIETVQSKNPLFFGYLNELTGEVITDYSGNDYHGTYYPEAVRGQPSPIETDPASFSVNNRVGATPAPAPVNNFSWGGWGYSRSDGGGGVILCRNGQVGTLGNHMSIGSQVGVRLLTTGAPAGVVLAYALPELDRFYRCMVARNGTHVELRVNGAVVAEVNDFPNEAMSSSGYVVNASGWKIGVSGDTGNIDAGYRTGPVEIYDYYLPLADDLEIFESAFNILSLFGVSNVISSAVLYSDIEPDPVNFPFRHNWTDPLIERLSFTTGISRAVKGYEQANQQRIKPRREIEISQLLRDDHEREALHAKLTANQHRKWFIPMLEDRERLIVPVASGVQVIPTDTLYKNYEIGGYVELRQLNDAGRVIANEHLLITGLEDDEVQTATQTVNSYTNPEAMPACRAIVSASQSLRGHTDSVEDTMILARLIAEDEKVVPRRIVEWTPLETYESYDVYPNALWPNDWSELRDYSIERDSREVDHELGSFTTESDALAANESFNWRILLQTKQQQAEFLGWFYAHAGSWNYLWVPSMQRNFIPVSSVGSDLTVEGHNYFNNFAGSEFRRDLAFVYNDNSMILRRIESVDLDGANEVLGLSSPGSATLTNLRSVSYLKFCRLDNDTLEIARITDTKARAAWMFREVLSGPA